MKEKLKTIIIIVLSIVIAIGFPLMYHLGKLKASGTVLALERLLEDSKTNLKKGKDRLDEMSVKLANSAALLLEQEAIIKGYKVNEQILTTVLDVKDINVNLFKEVEVKIETEEEIPWAIFSTDYELNPEIFGNFMEETQTIRVEYFYGVLTDHIEVTSSNGQVEINYSDDSFFNPPYRISCQKTELNAIGKLLTNSADNKAHEIINEVGINQLSNIEDAYLAKLKEQYENSEIPIYVNGILLEEWSEKNKVFSVTEIDPRYRVEVIED